MAKRRVVEVSKEDLRKLLQRVNKPVHTSGMSEEMLEKLSGLEPGVAPAGDSEEVAPEDVILFPSRVTSGPCIWRHGKGSELAAVPGEVLTSLCMSQAGDGDEDRRPAVAARFPFIRGREHAPKAAARMLLRKIGASSGPSAE